MYSHVMPDWQPRWDDVSFSTAAADAVTASAAALDRVVEAAIVSIVGLSHDARVGWTGPYVVEFESAYPDVMRLIYDLREALFDLQARVAAAWAAAAAEQSRRVQLRAQWRAEFSAELDVAPVGGVR